MKNHPFYQNGFLEGFKKGTEQERLRLKKEIEKMKIDEDNRKAINKEQELVKFGRITAFIEIIALLDDTPQKEEVKDA